jgi:hypothetical protein
MITKLEGYIEFYGGDVDILHISSHGVPGGVQTLDASNITVDSLTPKQAERLRNLFGKHGLVKFWSCNSAGTPRGKDRLQRLADELNVPVKGAIGDVGAGPNGLYGFDPFSPSPTWETFIRR